MPRYNPGIQDQSGQLYQMVEEIGRDRLVSFLIAHGLLQISRQYIPLSKSVKQGPKAEFPGRTRSVCNLYGAKIEDRNFPDPAML